MIQIYTLSRKIVLFLIAGFFILIGQNTSAQTVKWTDIFSSKNANFYQIQKSFNDQEEVWEREESKALREGKQVTENGGEEVYKRWASYMAPRVFPSGNLTLPTTNYANFLEWQRTIRNQSNSQRSNPNGGSWTELGPIGSPSGPSPYSRTGAGRTNFIRFVPNDTSIMYVGAPDGGLWKSTNSGASWTTNTDFLSVIGCSDLAIDPTNTQIMYLATGDLEGNRRSIGVWKSTNGGGDWSPTGLTWTAVDNYSASKLLMNPSNPLNMILATDGGTFRTTDGWATYTQGLFPAGSPSLKDMEFKPGNANILYAAGTQMFKSTDNGVNWLEITSGLPSADVQRIALGVTAGDSSYVYALIAKTSNQSFLGMYLSTDSGDSYTLKSTSPNVLGYDEDGLDSTAGQGFYDLAVIVSPTDPLMVTTGGVNHWQSADGGVMWSNLSLWNSGEVHADVHEITYLPGSSTTMFSCNDGGIFRSTDNGANFVDISGNLAIAQVVGIGLSATVATTIVNGEQDNGTNLKTGSSWNNISGGDGGECFIDPTDDNTIYIQYVSGAFSRSDDGGANATAIVSGLPTGFDFYSTWMLDPGDPNRLYVGGIPTLYTSANKGTNWTDLGTPSGSGTIKGIAIPHANPSIIYIIKDDAVSKSTDSGVNFTDITNSLPVGSAALSSIAVSNTNVDKIWVTFSGYSADNKVYKSINGGATWTNVSMGLPNLPVNKVLFTNGSVVDAIYVGGDIGVYYLDNTLTSFEPYFMGLPNVAVRDLKIFYLTGKLRAGTYGRGVWESSLHPNSVLPVTIKTFKGEIKKETNILTWTVTQEVNLANYSLQRSEDAINFSTIATIEAKAASKETSYNYIDNNPFVGTNFYRLQMNDLDNTVTYSNIIKLDVNKTNALVYPNPTSDNFSIGIKNTPFSVQLWDASGRLVYKNQNAHNKLVVDTRVFPEGIYVLEITTIDGEKQTHKVNVVR